MLSSHRWERSPTQILFRMVCLVSDCSGILWFEYKNLDHVWSKSTGESKLSIRNLVLGHHEKHPSKLHSLRNIIEM